MLDIKVKICGLSSSAAVDAAVDAGVNYIGCVFNINSVNYVTPLSARDICFHIPNHIKKIAVVSNISDKDLDEVMFYFQPDFVQFNGTETPEYISVFKDKFNSKAIKTFLLYSKKDLSEISYYEDVTDMFLLEPAPDYLERYYTHKKFFDWQMLKKIQTSKPWIISGNISKHNLALIIRSSKAKIINVDTSLESVIGTKDPVLISEFMKNLREFCDNETND
ncbi:MAG: phosphoribosylanthranilate isomerase [Candidatus Midichloria sp.]|nr:phosphoribosylanthranilate isomerase [Candidatus Midichloria sp.]